MQLKKIRLITFEVGVVTINAFKVAALYNTAISYYIGVCCFIVSPYASLYTNILQLLLYSF